MPLVIKPAGSISYTEINTAVVDGGGFATSSFNGLNAQAYTLTNSAVYLPPDKFSEFVGTSGNVFTFADWNGTVSVSSLGAVTFTVGNVVSVSVNPTSFDLVGTPTSRTISVSIVVPTGFSNAGVTLTGTKIEIQSARNFAFADWTGAVSINQEGVVSFTLGNAAAVSVSPTSFPIVSSDTSRTVSVTLTAPSGYFNAGTVLAPVNVTVTQPAKLFTYAMWTGVLSVSCDGVISATTGNAATPITFSPTSYPAVDDDTERKPTITITVPSGYGNSGQTITDSTGIKSAIQPKKFLTTTWTGTISINKNTGAVSATTGNAASIQSISPSTVDLVITPTNRSITVVIVIPSGYCNSGTLSITKTVSQAAADETINITVAGSHNTWQPSGQGDTATLSITTVSVWNTAWTIEVSDSAWIYIEEGTYTGTGNGTKTIAVQPNYVGSPGFNGSTRYGSVRVYKTGAYGLIYDIVNIQQAVGTPPVVLPTFTMSGKTHTFAWNAGLGSYHTITVSNFGGSLMTNGTFSMISNDFVLYDIDAHVTVSEDNPGDWVGTITNFAQASYSIGVYPKANNTSTTNTKTATIQFDASNSAGTSTDTATVTQAVSPPTFTIGDANVTGFAVAQNGAVTAPQAGAGTITNRVYSSGFNGSSYPRVNQNTPRSVVVTVAVPSGYSNSGGGTVSDTFSATQIASPTFTFGDAGVTGFAVDANGNITAPNATNATITNVTYNGSVNNTSYSIVNNPTSRTANVSIQVPAGYFNSGEIISSDVSTMQPQTDTFSFATANVTGFAVAQDGAVTEPTAQFGVISSRIYSSGYNEGYYPIVNVTTQRSVYVVVNVPSGYYNSGQQVDGTLFADQSATPTFTIAMAGVTGFAVAQNGAVTAPQASSGTITNRSYSSGFSGGSYPRVNTNTQRSVVVTVQVPGGYFNSSGTVSGTYYANQIASPTFTFSNTGTTGFAVSQDGNITAPYVTSGTLSSVTYIDSIDNSYYPIVGVNTDRYATVYVVIPNGYYLEGNIVSGNVSTTQPLTNTFSFGNANVTGFAVAQDGTITAPTAGAGTISSITYYDSIDNSYYPIVNGSTGRDAFVVVNVPAGYTNSGNQVSSVVTAYQPATPTFNFGDWNGSVSIGQDGIIGYSIGNANSVTINTENFPVVYSDTPRDISVTVYVPNGYYNSGGIVSGTKSVTQPAAPTPPDSTVTVYTRCNDNSVIYFVEGSWGYSYIEINGYCMYFTETTTRSNAVASGFTEFFSISESFCSC